MARKELHICTISITIVTSSLRQLLGFFLPLCSSSHLIHISRQQDLQSDCGIDFFDFLLPTSKSKIFCCVLGDTFEAHNISESIDDMGHISDDWSDSSSTLSRVSRDKVFNGT